MKKVRKWIRKVGIGVRNFMTNAYAIIKLFELWM